MSNATATYSDESIYVTFTATLAPDWDGAGQSFIDVSDIEIETLSILGVEINPVQFAAFPEELQAAIQSLGDDLTFEGDLDDDGDYRYEMSRDE